MLQALIIEGRRCLGEAPAKKATWRREKIHGAEVVFRSGVSGKAEQKIAEQLKHAYQLLKSKRFDGAWGGSFIIPAKAKKKGGSMRGAYNRQKDSTTLFGRVSKTTIIHELGHRWWYRKMTRANRLRFIDWVKAGLSPVSAYGGKDPWEAFAEAFVYFVLGKTMTPQQVETFKIVARGGRFEGVLK
jgi:hypothetical protein